MVSEVSGQEEGGVIDVREELRRIRKRQEEGMYPDTPSIEERMRSQGTHPFRSVDDIPRASFEFDVDEFLEAIYEARKS